MSQIIDRRLNGKNKSAVNRQRFLKRYKQQLKKAVADSLAERSITDIDSGEKISIPTRDISEPSFQHGQGGRRETIHPGNREFVAGDKIARPPSSSGGSGGKASKDGEGQDNFGFELSREEFLDLFFEDLALPDLVKTQLATVKEHYKVRAGYTSSGVPTNINIIRTMKGSLARRMALRAPYHGRLKALEDELAQLTTSPALHQQRILELEEEIRHVKARIRAIPFIDTFDLRYNNRVTRPRPTTKAVMFCLMDVSGSMDQERKNIAKRFFILLYLFLTRNYEQIDVVFIRHHTTAKEVNEDEFFNSRETGGTVVSSALKLMNEVISQRYPAHEWNIYGAQASDGDNWQDDSPLCHEILTQDLLPKTQYFAYVEITPDVHQSLWREYLTIKNSHANFAMQHIESLADIYPVFRQLFKKQVT